MVEGRLELVDRALELYERVGLFVAHVFQHSFFELSQLVRPYRPRFLFQFFDGGIGPGFCFNFKNICVFHDFCFNFCGERGKGGEGVLFCNLADLHFADVLFANTGFDTAEKTSMAMLAWSRTRSVFSVFRWRLFSRLFQCPRTTWIAWPRLEMGAQPCHGHRSVLSDGWRMGARVATAIAASD